MNFNLVISGIGGQGVLTLASLIGEAALCSGHDVTVTELHGLSQRFGPLGCHIRFGRNIHSPLVGEACADLLIGLERLEVLRAMKYAGRKTSILMDSREAVPTVLYLKRIVYPAVDEVVNVAKSFSADVSVINATEQAVAAGAPPVTANVYLAGVAVARGILPIGAGAMVKAMKTAMPAGLFRINKKVFLLGMSHDRQKNILQTNKK